ncbi:DUF1499 domain-containing protein [Cognatiyoonia sp. IB215182]|uniref:DUF1499 domain-containing protein n=1 Tax=Cognatiyoonia sp. IB215182 TaxID=3097353 RepID=UPI002A17BDF8|nr:DUF1499 domain-containing protein [Cognatiyoonia sp. IB215182]MDX8354721.1 DUF1499 domain-containing protein [Cognatiyoonia sp. IB215182]
MHLAVLLPYLIIVSGLALGMARLRPAMRPWGICITGALSGPVIVAALFTANQMPSWYLVAVSVAPFAVVFVMVLRDLSYPLINDVTTDAQNPPVFAAALRLTENAGRDMTYPQIFKAKARKSYPYVRSLRLNESADRIFDRIVDAANHQRGWRVHDADAARRTVEAEAVTPFLGFVDDVVIQVSEWDGMTWVDMRSKSREGLVDAGKNAKRIASFLEDLCQSGADFPGRENSSPTIITQKGAFS